MPGTRTEPVSLFPAGRELHQPGLPDDVRTGTASTLDELLKLHWHPLVSYASHLLDSADAAEDVVQETFLRLWERRTEWSHTDSVSFLYRITRNLALNEQRRRKVRARWLLTGEPLRRPGPTPLESAQESELRGAVEHALHALPPRRREAFVLARFHGLSYRQIAKVMGTSPQTTANQISAALVDLRRALEPFLEEPTTASLPQICPSA